MSVGINTNVESAIIVDFPNECPFCHNSVSPNPLFGFITEGYKMDVFYSCPKDTCQKTFIGEYEEGGNRNCFEFKGKVTKGTIVKKHFVDSIKDLVTWF